MATTRIKEASQTATAGGTEDTLYTVFAPGDYMLAIDVNALAAGSTPEILELRAYANARPSGTERLTYSATLTAGQIAELLHSTKWIRFPETGTIKLAQLNGTGRAFPYSIHRKGGLVGKVVSDAGNTASTFKTDLTAYGADNIPNRSFIRFLTGSLIGQVAKVSGFTNSTDFLTLADALTAAPAADDVFEFVNA